MSVESSITWADITINPLTGCNEGCEWCYARKFAMRHAGRFGYPKDDPFKPTFHFDKLAKLTGLKGKGKRVFLDSMGDWFTTGVDRVDVWSVIEAIRHLPDHQFFVLTKRPDRMYGMLHDLQGEKPSNLWFGVSVTCQDDIWRINQLANNSHGCRKFVSFEPLHGFIDCDLSRFHWVIIGAESGNRRGKMLPEPHWINHLVELAGDVPVFMKNNLRPFVGPDQPFIQEFPEFR